MTGKDRAFDLAAALIEASPADDTEVFFHEGRHHLTRFANNTIHQNVSVTDAEVLVRVAFGKKVGVASSNTLSDPAVAANADLAESAAGRALKQACEIARVSDDSTDYAGLPEPQPVEEVETFDEAAAGCDAMARAARVKNVVEAAKAVGAVAAGAFSTGTGLSGVVNSRGVRVAHPSTHARLNIVMMKDGGSGTTSRLGWRLADVDEIPAAKQVAERAVKTRDPEELEPGEYAVVLEPRAVGVLVGFLAYVGFGGKAYHEKRSFMSGKLGLKVTGPLITLTDDALDPAGIPVPFDYEGVPKRKVTFIRKGVAVGVCYDTATAAAEHTQSTGHALPSSSSAGPFPLNLFMEGGDSTLEKMISSTAKGLLVCNFHYVNVAERMKTVLTGMTRFGVFRIDGGRLTHPVKNLRFTQSVLEAFDAVSALTAERELVGGMGAGILVPAIKCDAFNFTGRTEF